jgi:TolA-binding protein
MKLQCCLCAAILFSTLVVADQALSTTDQPGTTDANVGLSLDQKNFLTQEPILVTVQVGERGATLPAGPGKSGGTTLRFEISPPVKARPGAKPLPLEAKGADLPATIRTYDLLEWYQFPAQGSWTVQAIVEHNAATSKSVPVQITIARPARGDKEQSPVDRLHHMPWSNYTTNAFCGDCFDLVKQWPQSHLARYAHYWNGVFHQNKKEYDKAFESFQTVATKYPDFVLANHARLGMIECLLAQQKQDEAKQMHRLLARRLQLTEKHGMSTVQLLCGVVDRQPLSAAREAKAGAVKK